MNSLPPKIQNELKEYFDKSKTSPEKQKEIVDTVKKLYRESIYDPYEPVGVVTAQSLSEPATQMSLDSKEKIILKKDGITATPEIGKFVDRMIKMAGFTENGWDVCDLSSYRIFVPSLACNEKIKWRQVLECSRHRAPEHLIRISLLSGRKITATDSHSFVVRKNNKIVPVKGSELVEGERIPVVRHIRDNCTQVLKLESFVDTCHAKKKMPDVLVLDRFLGWFMGAYIAEGNSTRYFVSISNTNPEFLSQIRAFAEHYGFTYNEYDNTRGFARGHDIRINSSLLSKFLKKTCGTGSKNKRIPQFTYGATREFVSGILRGYFDGDGNVSVGRKMIRASSNSEELINGVMLLLSRFGIFATKQKGKQFSIIIPCKYAEIFRKEIGFSVKKKQEKLDMLCSMGTMPRQDFTDMISGYGSLLMDVAKKLKYPTRYVNNFTRRGKIGRETLLRYINIFESRANGMKVDIKNEISLMKQMAYSDVVWDEIIKIEKVKPSSKYVYDLTVGGTETFTTFEGVVTHNTMRTYHFAGTAGIQVTLGLPRMLEIFDARKEPRTPTMMIYLEKEYQDLEKVREIANNIKEVKLRDIIISDILDLTELLIECRLDLEKIRALNIDVNRIPKMIKMRTASVKLEKDKLVVIPKKSDIKNLRKLKYNLLETYIKGIKGITQVVVTKEDNEWVINTLGSNLKKAFEINGVDKTRTYSNNIFEIQDLLGIEAARNAIIRQTQYTMEEQGLGVDIRYIMLLADLMTRTGRIKAIGRYGIAGQKASVLVRASFEETKKHFTIAAIKGETDFLRGTVENIMMNQVAPIGTGAFELIGKIPEAGIKPKKAGSQKKKQPKKKTGK